jgi:predicted acyltransferase
MFNGMAINWVGYMDKATFSSAHLFGKFDPEGLLSTIPAIATTLSDLITGSFLLSTRSKLKPIFEKATEIPVSA